MTFKKFLKNNLVILDGGMGTLLQNKGLLPGELPERWNVSHPEVIREIHTAYLDAGSNVISTNTFGANCLKFDDNELNEIIFAAVDNAKAAVLASNTKKETFIALDLGPTGKLLKPYGDLDFEEAVNVFKKSINIGVKAGVDLVFIETMNDSYETKAALLAAKESCDLPVIVSNAYGADEKLMTGATPEAMVAMLEGLGADAVGANCSLGPKQLIGVAKKLLEAASVPVLLKPNAGLPKMENGATVYNVTAEEFAKDLSEIVKMGVRAVGGCCGTTPEYISALAKKIEGYSPIPISLKNNTIVSSYSHTVKFGNEPILIGERINPTGKKRFKQALAENDMAYILNEGVKQKEKEVHILDVNVGLPEIDEAAMLTSAVTELQAILDLPLQIDTADPNAMEQALRRYNGKAMINSVSGKLESMEAIFPLAKKYGGVVVCLTLDESGIPETAEKRIEIAEKILTKAEEYGIHKKDLIFDTLALTVSADSRAAVETLTALRHIREKMGCHTSLGVSNISFGLPVRDAINGTFFAMALENGLSAAIMNPFSADMMKTYFAFRALRGLDDNCADYIAHADEFQTTAAAPIRIKEADVNTKDLQGAIQKGLCEQAKDLTEKLVQTKAPLDVVNSEIIPALNKVGVGFEEKRIFLPQLLMSAEAAKSAFEVIKAALSETESTGKKAKFVLATVKGDIHDIGKNIVKLLLENYGFDVIDLGKDVAPNIFVEKVIEVKAPFAGLSALMTTTVPAMEETVRLLHKKAPWCKVIVGGAVLTEEYAKTIGADHYAPDAMAAVRWAELIEQRK
ncbi:MAG: homocysteine methyltransferase [Ruminococcaceae bacterium]|nr:homocysteine methyltransferase [Oscillospiraceae bacterium]